MERHLVKAEPKFNKFNKSLQHVNSLIYEAVRLRFNKSRQQKKETRGMTIVHPNIHRDTMTSRIDHESGV
ncbi:hypothetical protein PRIPAC_81509 [Pristionchus pacificus]|uniref:Uncharacterized protein n=1 Tax=Pristionchus pacificus TaxID=54126 RepID=A0A2A6BY90_PRIPA|nr:hypothetical protein PRIPAC_81509 [Pristionchus pacificus]|eukprot:PDM70914.1 hypothetical protein PRIPAC_44310 [Pristionchus pacificus]